MADGRPVSARGVPPPDPTAAFHRLVGKRVNAGYLCRWAREAELSSQAAAQAEMLFRADSLVSAHLRVYEAGAYRFLARANPSGAEREALKRRAWRVLTPVCALLLRRLAANTLLPGTCRPDEVCPQQRYVVLFFCTMPCLLSHFPLALKVSFDADEQGAAYLLTGEKPPPRDALLLLGAAVGYTTLLEAACHALNLLTLPLWPDAEREEARHKNSFTEQALSTLFFPLAISSADVRVRRWRRLCSLRWAASPERPSCAASFRARLRWR